jgi:uncharacterized protein (DUF4415 family)
VAEPKTDWKRLRRMSDKEVRRALENDPEIQPTDSAFWKEAKIVMPHRKEIVTMRLDADLLSWLRRERGYQTRVNAVLRAYMKAQEKPGHTATAE